MNDKIILLVEDNPDDEALTRRAMERNRILNPIVVARDGQEALDLLFGTETTPAVVPEVILLDLNLPKRNGLDVLRRLRATPSTRLLPVVILTTSCEDRDRLESYSLGANSYVRKPIEFEEFCAAIRQLGMYWLVLNQGPTIRTP